ncbi:RnfABCDGE type electron transport complex subunit G [Tissierella sp. Yu-01]|uniref:RnfABCDGE type electron transport complex subunit G n=1 Tax=Tissierella sp. Yu-01 TaxID=3035694 RepID=UPI00240D483F|nr:RnfABCDGE type electron transport complex subunit G [Tissierella sp. Yu-01]WFA09480.1 RnfABCDGE type electron transport complex subunit G [Tissierella sp. Yu-01]
MKTVRYALVLLVVGIVAGGVLAYSNSITAPIIAEQQKAGSLGAFAEVFPEADDFVAIDEALLSEITSNNSYVQEVYEAKVGDETIGYGFKTVSGGYGGDIVTVSGFSLEGTVAGIRVIENSETPGLGTKVVDDTAYQESYVGKSASENLVVVASPAADNEVLLLSGATVSSNGVLTGVNGAREAFVNFFAN